MEKFLTYQRYIRTPGNASVKFRILDTDYESYSVAWSCENKPGYNLSKKINCIVLSFGRKNTNLRNNVSRSA